MFGSAAINRTARALECRLDERLVDDRSFGGDDPEHHGTRVGRLGVRQRQAFVQGATTMIAAQTAGPCRR